MCGSHLCAFCADMDSQRKVMLHLYFWCWMYSPFEPACDMFSVLYIFIYPTLVISIFCCLYEHTTEMVFAR